MKIANHGLSWCNTSNRLSSLDNATHGSGFDMHIPAFALPVLTTLRPTCSTPTDKRCLVLLLGTLLTTGRRTITNILRTVRHQAPGHAASDQRVCSRRRWSMWVMARAVLRFLRDHVVPPGPVLLAGDDPVTEHPGPHVFGKGRHRDGVRSSHRDPADRWGHPWVVLSMRVQVPCATRPWALPGLVALVPSPGVGSCAWHAASNPGAQRPVAAGTPGALVSGASCHLWGRQRRWYQRDGAVWQHTPPAPPLGEQVLWRCRPVGAAATAHTQDDGTPARDRLKTGLSSGGRGEHSHAHQPHSGVGLEALRESARSSVARGTGTAGGRTSWKSVGSTSMMGQDPIVTRTS
jgi:hypothetical protein